MNIRKNRDSIEVINENSIELVSQTVGTSKKPLALLIKSRDIAGALNLVHLGEHPDAQDEEGNTLLHILVEDNEDGKHDETIAELVKKYDATIDMQNSQGLTPFQCFISKESFFSGQALYLVRLGANPNNKDKHGTSFLHILAKRINNKNGKNNKTIAELVNEHHADIDIQNAEGLTPLQCLIDGQFFTEEAMNLVRLGANPDQKAEGEVGSSLLHILVHCNNKGWNDKAIAELVNEYHADINIQNAIGFTPLQRLIQGKFSTKAAMKLVYLGADFNFKDPDGALIEILSLEKNNKDGKNNEAIEELYKISFRYNKEKHHQERNVFLNLLILLANDRNNTSSKSSFKILSIDLIARIASYLSNREMGKTQEECYSLAHEMLLQSKKFSHLQTNETIENYMMSSPGGVNVFQHDVGIAPNIIHKFKFFKSAEILCLDYENEKTKLKHTQHRRNPFCDFLTQKKYTNTSIKILNTWVNQHAIPVLNEQSSLYRKRPNKQKILNHVKDQAPYKDLTIPSQMKK